MRTAEGGRIPRKPSSSFYGREGRLIAEKDLSTAFWTDYIYNGSEPIAQIVNQPPWITIGRYLMADKTGGYVHLDWTLYGGSETFRVYRTTNDFTFSSPSMVQELTPKAYDDNVLRNSNNYAYKILKAVPSDAAYYYHTDHLMTPLFMTDASQATVWQGEYDPFGQLYTEAGTASNILRFPGQFADPAQFDKANYYNGARWYRSLLGRYQSADPLGPIEEEINLFEYSLSNPIIMTDPMGLSAQICCRFVKPAVLVGPLTGYRHCYIVSPDGARYGLYPKKVEQQQVGQAYKNHREDKGGKCKNCETNCSDQSQCFNKTAKNYPVGEYHKFGPNSNTFAATMAKTCCKGGFPEGMGNTPGIDDTPPTPIPGAPNNPI